MTEAATTPEAASPNLPSGDAAVDLVQKPSVRTFSAVVGTMLVRGAIIGAGLYVGTEARGMRLVKYTVAATSAVELAVLLWATQAKPK